MHNTLILDGSFCPHFKVGGWAFGWKQPEEEGADMYNNIILQSGGLPQGYDPHYCEAHALYEGLMYVCDRIGTEEKIVVVSDSQNMLAVLKKQVANRIMINYFRKPPWDLIKECIRYNPNIKGEWQSLKKSENENLKLVHTLAKSAMESERAKLLKLQYNQ